MVEKKIQRPVRPKQEKVDESIMGTNNSSIVSKRSVERLYFPHEEHFFRHFVKKPQRRAPLINRGYWLRMQAIEYVVRHFLSEHVHRPRVVVNLGCGYDPLPFQCLSRYPELCRNAKFVDIDYAQLMAKKADMISQTQELQKYLPNLKKASSSEHPVLLNSDQYIAVGCDLREIDKLRDILASEIDIEGSLVLFVAEVSITYMDVEAADKVISWSSGFQNSRFCLLEQFFPDTAAHPFAETMMKHFNKIQTPLKSVNTYPERQDQVRRFRDAGWPISFAHSLWDLWSNPGFLTSKQRIALDSIEPFDEWEEFALFASHYFLLVASKGAILERDTIYSNLNVPLDNEEASHDPTMEDRGILTFRSNPKDLGRRRYGAIVELGKHLIGHHGGTGTTTRLTSTDLYKDIPEEEILDMTPPRTAMLARMCHTITKYKEGSSLLVGGRISPNSALDDCWRWSHGAWQRVEDIPGARYRHCATFVILPLTISDDKKVPASGVLVYGGKDSHGKVLDDWLLWDDVQGWRTLKVDGGAAPGARFGASMIHISSGFGILIGGMGQDGTILKEYWEWSLVETGEALNLILSNKTSSVATNGMSRGQISRFGAGLSSSPGGALLIGGICSTGVVNKDVEMLLIDVKGASVKRLELKSVGPRPLLIGSSTSDLGPDRYVIVGGGAVCFSFGTFWNEGSWTLDVDKMHGSPWLYCRIEEISASIQGRDNNEVIRSNSRGAKGASTGDPPITPIQRVHINTREDFEALLLCGRPAILTGLDIGACTSIWALEYLRQQIGAQRQVIVHQASGQAMNFVTKNFSYITQTMGDFLQAVEDGQRVYFRALAAEKPTETSARLSRDFPEIAEDFHLPSQLAQVRENEHSSPLRISGPVSMWLHYDVMANVLFQIRGTKRLILYPPSDVVHLGFAPGSSSSTLDPFTSNTTSHPALVHTTPYEASLEPGDALFIPALWLHASALTDGASIGLNVFFRSLQKGYAAGKDVYGNRDVQAYENGRRAIQNIVRSFRELPHDMGQFYLLRLADELHGQVEEFAP